MDSTPFPPIVHSKLNTGKEPFKCGMENAECGVRHNLISVIAKHRAPRQRFCRSAACPKPQRVRTHEPARQIAGINRPPSAASWDNSRSTQSSIRKEYRKKVPVHLRLNFTRQVVCTRLQPSNAHFRTYKLGSDISATHFPISGTGFRISGNPFRISGIQFRIFGTACRILRRGFRDMRTAGLISGGDFLSLGNICLIYGNDFPLSGRVERIHGNVRRLSGNGANPFPAPRRNVH